MKVVKEVFYLRPGAESSDILIEAVVKKAKESAVTSVVVASTLGKSAIRLAESLEGVASVLSVTEFTYEEKVKKRMKKLGVTAIERAELPIQDRRDMKDALLFFGIGVKAALEVAAIAAEKGIEKDNIIAVAGSNKGLDTALLVRPAPPSEFSSPNPEKRMAVLEFIALPLER